MTRRPSADGSGRPAYAVIVTKGACNVNFLSPDSKFMQELRNLTDAIWINILMIVTSIPVITIGAAITAAHDASRRALQGEAGGVTANYFKAFRTNFVKSTGLWAVFGITGAALAYAGVVLQITPLLIPKFGLTIVWMIGFEWVFALQARFENSVGRTLMNAFVFGVSRILLTSGMIVIDVVWLGLLAACWFYFPQGLFLLVVMGYGTMILCHIPLLERGLTKYLKSDADGGAKGE